ncbi:helix-turn-helix transcriptional regulator [Paenibacillus alba]|uniref:winged helix-turn-helix domain-containing protein n=1 Tax=Paenibacillus alba TaxID=1197127 RepID=UPI001566301F|nr:helix-turn-helix domain-containing protein [Paenibacillus alba]NQX68760.1 helix-turn-helix transcriptional regulator [Paenibacillus alba]
MDEIYEITSYEQAKVISNKLRMRIISTFEDGIPRTSKQVADELGLPASKVHYHVRELAKVNLLLLKEKKDKGGIIEKYYLPIAQTYRICLSDEFLSEEGEKSGRYIVAKSVLEEYQDSILSTIVKLEQMKEFDTQKAFIKSTTLLLSKEKQIEFYNEITDVFERWSKIAENDIEQSEPTRIMMTAHRKL